MMGQSDSGGFFAGPTSALSHLLAVSITMLYASYLILTSCRNLATMNDQAALINPREICRLPYVTPCTKTQYTTKVMMRIYS